MDIYSGFSLSQTDGRPMYLQIIEQVKLRVRIGDWVPGHRLPSIREMAIGLRVSVITVKRAYMELEREHIITTQQGKGSFVARDLDLVARIEDEDMDRHLEQVIRRAMALGVDLDDLKQRVTEKYDTMRRELT